MSDLLDRLQLILAAEREAGDLLRLSPAIIAATIEERETLYHKAQAGDKDALNRYDAMTEFMETIVTFRAKKIFGRLSQGVPPNATAVEAAFHATVAEADAELRRAWGLQP